MQNARMHSPSTLADRRLWRALLVALALLACAGAARAGGVERVVARGYFTYGSDQEGGGPYIYPDPKHPGRLVGFEVELADALAAELSRRFGKPLRAQFFQGAWEQLPNLLRTGRVDTVLNGYEWTPERAAAMVATDPYYVYRLQLLARMGDARIDSLASLRRGGFHLGVLAGSAAETYAHRQLGAGNEISLYDGNTNAMLDTESGRLDATLQDTPIAAFYRADYPGLRFVDAPVAPGHYVMYLNRGDEDLAEAFNDAIARLNERGVLRDIYTRYGIWSDEQQSLGKGRLAAKAVTPESASAPGFWERHGLTLLQAAGMTIVLAVTSMPVAIVLGVLVALGRMYGPRWLGGLLATYVEILRGTPLLLQLLVIFYLLPSLGLTLPAVVAGILGLAINYSAYEAEIYRAGLQAVPAGQLEAALTLGMSRPLAVRRIVLPQAGRIVIPAVTNDFIALFKDTSICSVITVVELSKRYNIAVNNNPGELLPLAGIVAILYLLMSYPLSVLSRRLEARLRR